MSEAAQRPEPLFVLGCPRSGTTLLAELLAATPWGKPTETMFIDRYYRRLDIYGDLSDAAALERLAADVLAERSVQQWKLGWSAEELVQAVQTPTYRGLIDAVMGRRAALRGTAGWGDKSPHYTRNLDALLSLFPQSRYVFIVRDGRDVALSLLGRRWGPNNLFCCAEYWVDYHRPSAELSALEQSGQLHRIRYESLLETPQEQVAELYAFLGHQVDTRRIAELTASIRPGNKEKWRSKLTRGQIDLFDRVAAETLERFEYPVSRQAAPVGGFTRWRYHLHDKAARLVELAYANTIEAARIRWMGAQPFAD